jgi:hypothetical protein
MDAHGVNAYLLIPYVDMPARIIAVMQNLKKVCPYITEMNKVLIECSNDYA